jgi:hypothetical protein
MQYTLPSVLQFLEETIVLQNVYYSQVDQQPLSLGISSGNAAVTKGKVL